MTTLGPSGPKVVSDQALKSSAVLSRPTVSFRYQYILLVTIKACVIMQMNFMNRLFDLKGPTKV